MQISDNIFGLPGKLHSSVFDIDTKNQVPKKSQETGSIKKDARVNPFQENSIKALTQMIEMKPKFIKKEIWGRQIPLWNKKDDKDDKKKESFKKTIKEIKDGLGNVFEKQHDLLMQQYPPKEEADKEHQTIDILKLQAKEEVRDLKMRSITIPLQIDSQDIFNEVVPIADFLKLFIDTFKYTQIKEYIKAFPGLSQAKSKIASITQKTHKNRLIYHNLTVEGQIKAKQLNAADMFNQRLIKAFDQLFSIACGAFYCPDSYFAKAYNVLPDSIRKLLTVKMMRDKLGKPLYEVIGCGESVNFMTFEADVYSGYLKEIAKQFETSGTWEPFNYYSKAVAYKKSKDRVKGVAPFYTRCGYEKYLLINAECILLYFVFQMAKEQQKTPLLNGNEFIVFKDKVQDCIIHFDQFNERKDELWLRVAQFVQKRTGGIQVKEVDYEAEGAVQKEEEQKEVITTFRYQGLEIDYITGKVTETDQADEEFKVEEEKVEEKKKIDLSVLKKILNKSGQSEVQQLAQQNTQQQQAQNAQVEEKKPEEQKPEDKKEETKESEKKNEQKVENKEEKPVEVKEEVKDAPKVELPPPQVQPPPVEAPKEQPPANPLAGLKIKLPGKKDPKIDTTQQQPAPKKEELPPPKVEAPPEQPPPMDLPPNEPPKDELPPPPISNQNSLPTDGFQMEAMTSVVQMKPEEQKVVVTEEKKSDEQTLKKKHKKEHEGSRADLLDQPPPPVVEQPPPVVESLPPPENEQPPMVDSMPPPESEPPKEEKVEKKKHKKDKTQGEESQSLATQKLPPPEIIEEISVNTEQKAEDFSEASDIRKKKKKEKKTAVDDLPPQDMPPQDQ